MFSIAEIEGAQRLGAGANRYCVVSPYDNNICLKIILPEEQRLAKNWRQKIQRYLSSHFIRFNENYIEWVAYQHLTQKISEDILKQHIAPCIELEQTSLGLILSTELVRNQDGEISLSLHHYLKHKIALDLDQVCQAIDEFAYWLIQYNIPLFDLNSGNVVVQKYDQSLQLKCIDVKSTFKSKEIIPISYWSKKLMHKKILRRAERLKTLMKHNLVGLA